MKYFITATLLLLRLSSVTAQDKNNYVWILGNTPNDELNKKGGTMIDFNFQPPKTSFFELQEPSIGPYNSICNDNGELQFYTNGCKIINKLHEPMGNGAGLNPGDKYVQYCLNESGYPTYHSTVIIPNTIRSKHYDVYHLAYDDNIAFATTLYRTTIDMEADDGNGEVIEKNIPVFKDTLEGLMTGIRHGNGRDWWLLAPKGIPGYGMYSYLVTPESVSSNYQEVQEPFYLAVGQMTFSPDGAWLVHHDGRRVYVCGFDRCTGLLSFKEKWELPRDTLSFVAGGVTFSPDSRLLYVSSGAKLRQYDLNAANIQASEILLAANQPGDWYPDNTYYIMDLAPDNKIYISNFSTQTRLHVINSPNERGLACDLQPNTFELPTQQWIYLPVFPPYRVYDLPASPCDTLCRNNPAIGNAYGEEEIEIFPNPARTTVKLRLPLCPCLEWEVYNIAGIRMERFSTNTLTEAYLRLDVSDWSSGIYVVRGKTTEGQAYVKKFAVVH